MKSSAKSASSNMKTYHYLLGVIVVSLFPAILGFGQCLQRRGRTIGKRQRSISLQATRGRGESIPLMEQQYSTYLATCVPGLAHVLQQELEDLRTELSHPDGITDVTMSGNAAVTFDATREASLHALCWLRSAHRLLELVATTDNSNDLADSRRFNGKNVVDRDSLLYTRDDLHNFVRECVDVKELLGDGKGGLLTISVKATMNNARQLPKDLSHSHYTALSIKNSLCDVVRDMRGDRPDVDTDNPDLPLVAILRGMGDNNFDEGAASLSIYRSLHPPGSLHKRGYRAGGAMHKAAMKESMAAGLLLEAGWNEKVQDVVANIEGNDIEDVPNESHNKLRMVDPMAGSGSLVLEACMMATDIAPGLMRIRCGVPNHSSPPVTRWKFSEGEDVDVAWKKVLLGATKRAKDGIKRMRDYPSLIQIEANDIHPRAVDIMEESLEAAGLANFVHLSNMDCYDMDGGKGRDDDEDSSGCEYFVATNPPW
jgi:23S rRNA G2445 N2-methylase RlmL